MKTVCFRIASHRLSQRLLQRRRVLQRRLRIIQLQWRKLHWCGCSSEGSFSNNPRALLKIFHLLKKTNFMYILFPKGDSGEKESEVHFHLEDNHRQWRGHDQTTLPGVVIISKVLSFWSLPWISASTSPKPQFCLPDLFLVSILPQSYL